MPLSWNEIKHNAIQFSREWTEATSERADAKTFWDEFFNVFGIKRRMVASFEEPVKSIRGTYDLIDLFWKGTLIAEHKSAGGDLDKAHSQAMTYIQDLKNEKREDEAPRYVAVCDFRRFVLHDLEEDRSVQFALGDLHRHIHEFAFIPGYTVHKIEDEDPINIKAVGLMGNLHDALEDSGYTPHPLERYLVRVLFCLFADDTGIFDRNVFTMLIEQTRENGSDVGHLIAHIFEVLNTPDDERLRGLDETIASLPFVNGSLFEEKLPIAAFDARMRRALLSCCRFDWSRISPAIFGSLFQSVMEPRERRQIGGHYTSERDILKVVGALFLDELLARFKKLEKNKNSKTSRQQLYLLHERIAGLRFLDPACGCGNFLVVAYRELRALEIEILRLLVKPSQQTTGIDKLSRIDVDAMYGIEISEFPARIAEVALWLTDHQMNLKLSEAFGHYFVRLPLRKSPTIAIGNALRMDWRKVLPPDQCSYVLGNPPFVGAKFQTDEQRADMKPLIKGLHGGGLLDYVCGWYLKAVDYIGDESIKVAFVSTNSISQGEQVGVLWTELFRHDVTILFAHRTFPWESEARGKAHVHVVIVGFGKDQGAPKTLYDYDYWGDDQIPLDISVRNISPYLVEGPDIVITNREQPLCRVPEIGIGNKPIDNGHYLFTAEEKAEFLNQEPAAEKYFRRWVGSEEFIRNKERWCLWLGECTPAALSRIPEALKRVRAVRKFRLASKSAPTKKLADYPTHFHVENMPKSIYMVIPKVSSEKRSYIPIGFLKPSYLTSDLCFLMPGAKIYHFGILTSKMHMTWVRQICGRLKSDYRYSAKLVYNNFPWPDPTYEQREAVEMAAKAVLVARAQYPRSSLAELYDPLKMPKELHRAHHALDRAVDCCYRRERFRIERDRLEFLFALYEELVSPLAPSAPSGPRRPKKPRKKAAAPREREEDRQLRLFAD